MKRYLLDLSELLTDHRQKAYIGHRTEWSTVGCVISTIRKTFNIESDIYICSEEGIFYPECESVELIRDDKTIKILRTEQVQQKCVVSDDEPSNRCVSNFMQDSSTYEDIESVLLGLPKPKRHRVRKRKSKQVASEEPSSQSALKKKERVQQTKDDAPQNGHIRFSYEESQLIDDRKSSDEITLSYRNLNREMKARVVRAVSPSALNKQRCEPPTTTATNEATNASEPIKCISKPIVKPRIIRAMPCTVEVKQELLAASAMETNAELDTEDRLQQSYHPLTVEETNVIVIDSPTPVNGEEATHSTDVPAV